VEIGSSSTAEIAAWVSRIVLGVTFLVSGVTKLRDLDALAFGILRYQLLPARRAWALSHPLARLLTAAELGLAAVLLCGIALRLAGAASLLHHGDLGAHQSADTGPQNLAVEGVERSRPAS
jgi:uncharacterized membrane protein YphA (DoxX/SURF4 family)